MLLLRSTLGFAALCIGIGCSGNGRLSVRSAASVTSGVTPVAGFSKTLPVRWVTTSARPIRVRIDEAHRLAAWTPADRERVIAALERWMATGIPVRFTVVPDGSEADLVVGWADHLPKGYSGWTSLQWDGSGAIMRGTVTLALLDTRDAPLPNRIRDAVVLHELGHALGLPHSSTPQALMWPVTSADAALTASDSIAVHELYNVDARPRAVTTR